MNRLGKRVPNREKTRLLLVRFASNLHRSTVLKWKIAQGHFTVFWNIHTLMKSVRTIKALYSTLKSKQLATGCDYYFHRYGPVMRWSVVESPKSSKTSVQQGTNCIGI